MNWPQYSKPLQKNNNDKLNSLMRLSNSKLEVESQNNQLIKPIEEGTICNSLCATIPTDVGQTKFSAYIDTGTTRNCISNTYYHTIGFPHSKHLFNVTPIFRSGDIYFHIRTKAIYL